MFWLTTTTTLHTLSRGCSRSISLNSRHLFTFHNLPAKRSFSSSAPNMSSLRVDGDQSAQPANNDQPLDILLIGLGGIGAFYSYLLESTGKARVTAVARSNYDLYNSGKVTLDSDKLGKHVGWKPYRVCKSQAEALEGDKTYDYALITTKCLPDVLPTPKLAHDAIQSRRIKSWVLIQNGLNVEEGLYQAVKDQEAPIISCAAWIGIMTNPEGSVVNHRGFDHLATGLYPPLAPEGSPQTRQFSEREIQAWDTFVNLLKDAGAGVYKEDRMDSIRYSKNIWNCSWASIQGLVRGTTETFVDFTEEEVAPIKAFMREVVDVGFKAGLLKEGMKQYPLGGTIGTPESVAHDAYDKIYQMSLEKIKNGVPPHKMSLLIDVEQGRPFEVEVITGEVLRLAKKIGFETPNLAMVYSLMKGLQYNILKQKANKEKS